MARQLCVIPGDGIGPEVTSATVSILRSIDPDLNIIEAEAGWGTFEKLGTSVPQETLEAIRETGAALFGAVSSPSRKVAGYRSAILTMRQELNLFANIRPVDSNWSQGSREGANFIVVRENTEGLYVGRETETDEGAIAERVITRQASTRIGQQAARLAIQLGLPNITVVHKANVLPKSDGLFRDCVIEAIQRECDQASHSIEVDELLVDIAAFHIASDPSRFRMIVTTNMFGDILSDLGAVWCGGMGRAPSINLGDQVALAEPVHGSAPDIAGKGLADPTATILSAALLYRYHWREESLANQLETLANDVTTTVE